MRLSPVPAAIVLAAAAAAALLARHVVSVAVITALLLVVCLRAPHPSRRLYLAAVLATAAAVFLLSPLLAVEGATVLWRGPSVPVLGTLDVTWEEVVVAALNALRLAAVGLAFSAYALLLDHDRLVGAASFARRSALGVALATRLVPTLERDAAGLAEAVRGRGVPVTGVRGRARLLSPLVAGSLERALNLAEAMETRGFGRPGRTRAPRARWGRWDAVAVTGAALLVVAAALWL